MKTNETGNSSMNDTNKLLVNIKSTVENDQMNTNETGNTAINDTKLALNNTITTTENDQMTHIDTSTTPLTEASETMNNQAETLENVTSVTVDKVLSLAEASTGFFEVIKPQIVKKIADRTPEELRGCIRIKLFPRKDGLITVYATLAGITPLLIGGEKSFQVASITKPEALAKILAMPKHILDNMLLIAQSDYVSTKRHSASEEAKKERLENKTLKALAKRNKKREKINDLEVSNALFEAKKKSAPSSTKSKNDTL